MRSGKVIQSSALLVAALFAGTIAAVCVIVWQQPKPIDFLGFWAAGKMVIAGNPAGVFDIAAHKAVQQAAVSDVGNFPFPYPPPFALLAVPFALLPLGVAFTVWVTVTGVLYVVASRGWMRPRLAVAQPAVLINGFIGQNAFLTSGLLFGGMRLLRDRPILAGAVLGALVVKPQLGLMLPVAMLAGRQWRAIGGAILSATGLLLLGWIALGSQAYRGFLGLLSAYPGFIAANRWPWHELASVFALLKYFGVPSTAALAIHVAAALTAAGVVWLAWREDREGKEAILAAATLLGSPYVLSYDAVLLALPTAWLLTRRPALGVLVWTLALVPVGAIFGFYEFPNTMPLAALLSMAVIYRTGKACAPAGERSSPEPAW